MVRKPLDKMLEVARICELREFPNMGLGILENGKMIPMRYSAEMVMRSPSGFLPHRNITRRHDDMSAEEPILIIHAYALDALRAMDDRTGAKRRVQIFGTARNAKIPDFRGDFTEEASDTSLTFSLIDACLVQSGSISMEDLHLVRDFMSLFASGFRNKMPVSLPYGIGSFASAVAEFIHDKDGLLEKFDREGALLCRMMSTALQSRMPGLIGQLSLTPRLIERFKKPA